MDQLHTVSEKSKRVFLEGMKKYQDRGIPIYVDGKKADEKMLEKIFEYSEDGFYMGDYVMEEVTCGRKEFPDSSKTGILREPSAGYYVRNPTSRYCLKEIRFDKIHHDSV